MTPKEKREILFKKTRPKFRPLNVFDGDKYHKDIALLWVAHKRKPFYALSKDLDQNSFAKEMVDISKNTKLLIAEDKNKEYENVGPVGLFAVHENGWKVEPHAEYFPWATKKNVLRATVSFLQMIRYQKIGACVVYTPECYGALFDKCCEYGVLHKVGAIVNGDERGDELVYSVRGKRDGRIV